MRATRHVTPLIHNKLTKQDWRFCWCMCKSHQQSSRQDVVYIYNAWYFSLTWPPSWWTGRPAPAAPAQGFSLQSAAGRSPPSCRRTYQRFRFGYDCFNTIRWNFSLISWKMGILRPNCSSTHVQKRRKLWLAPFPVPSANKSVWKIGSEWKRDKMHTATGKYIK